MTRLALEDFASPAAARSSRMPTPKPPSDYDNGYAAGWEDASNQSEMDGARLSSELHTHLMSLQADHADVARQVIAGLEPLLHDIFDKLLPRAVERSFVTILLEEIRNADAEADGALRVLVAPEEAASLAQLIARTDLAPRQITVEPEPALALSQALIQWDGEERRIDMDAVLGALDDALDTYLATLAPDEVDAPLQKETVNG
ncbi:MAG: hypothetical protein AAF919_07375 [Pseudomonadota bacterium]